jgi:hypothetical protein
MAPQNKKTKLDMSTYQPVQLDMSTFQPAGPEGVQQLASAPAPPSAIRGASEATGIGPDERSMGQRLGDWWTRELSSADPRSPQDIAKQVGGAAGFAATVAPAVVWPMATARGMVGGALGSAGGRWLGRETGIPGAETVGGVAGGLYGGYRGMKGLPVKGRLGMLSSLLSEEPAVAPGAAREMAGGTAATTTDTALGSQAGPSQGPKNAGELSSIVQRVRSGTAPGTAASPLVTLEEAAKQGGMASAAGGGPAWEAQAYTPSQQAILQKLRQKGIVGNPYPFPGGRP